MLAVCPLRYNPTKHLSDAEYLLLILFNLPPQLFERGEDPFLPDLPAEFHTQGPAVKGANETK